MEKLVEIEDSTSKCDSEHYRTKYKVVTNSQTQSNSSCFNVISTTATSWAGITELTSAQSKLLQKVSWLLLISKLVNK